MTVRVRVVLGTMGPSWSFGFSQRNDYLHASRERSQGKWHTLDGAYPLLLDEDDNHTLVNMNVLPGSKHWQVQDDLQTPLAEPGQVFVVESIIDDRPRAFLTDPDYTILHALLGAEGSESPVQHVAIDERVVLDIDPSGILVGVWMLDLPPEIAEVRLVSSTGAGADPASEGDTD